MEPQGTYDASLKERERLGPNHWPKGCTGLKDAMSPNIPAGHDSHEILKRLTITNVIRSDRPRRPEASNSPENNNPFVVGPAERARGFHKRPRYAATNLCLCCKRVPRMTSVEKCASRVT